MYIFRFCVSVYRQHYPRDPPVPRRAGSPTQFPRYRQPGHVITVMPPVRVENLLPMELTYSMKVGGSGAIRSAIKPGQVAPLIMVGIISCFIHRLTDFYTSALLLRSSVDKFIQYRAKNLNSVNLDCIPC